VNTSDIVDDLIREVPPEGIYTYSDLLQTVREKKFHGVGLSETKGKKTYILFLEGEPEGAIVSDSKGELFGNKAIYLIRGEDRFTLFPLNPAMVERIVFGCRIYDKSHFTRSYSLGLPEIGKKAEGIGRLIIAVKNAAGPVADIPVKIRKNGQIVGNDVTNQNGIVSFRLLYGLYEVLIVRTEQDIDVYEFSFASEHHEKPLDLEIG
jgi:hypothetical protein